MDTEEKTCDRRCERKVSYDENPPSKVFICLFSALFKIRENGIRFLDQFHNLSARDGDSDRQIASIRQKLTFFKHSYIIYSIYGEYKIKGLNIFDHSFVLKNKDDKTIAIVNKKFLSFADTYEIEILDSLDDKDQDGHAFILAIVIVLHSSLYSA